MATYVLLHGAASDSWYWHRVRPLLEGQGHEVVAPDLPCEDETAGFEEYAQAVIDAIGDRSDVILVAQSMAGYTAGLVCARIPVDLVILVAAMIPTFAESGGEWWANTGQPQAEREAAIRDGRPVDGEFDPVTIFLHDVPEDVVAESAAHVRAQSGRPFEDPWPLERWPDTPTRFLLCRHDRLFPADFMRRVVRARLGITPDEIESGHLPALAHPEELVAYLEACRLEREAG